MHSSYPLSLGRVEDDTISRGSAHASLLEDTVADITHSTHLDPVAVPPVLSSAPPPITVTVSEVSVTFARAYPAAPLQHWQAQVLEVPVDSEHEQREQGMFLTPGPWVDRWDIDIAGQGDRDGTKTLYFTQAITPVNDRTTAHSWRVRRNYDTDGPRRPVAVRADAAKVAVRKIMRRLTAEDGRPT